MKNDKIANKIFEFTGRVLGEAFANFTVLSSPKAIILFGGLTKSGELLMRPIREAMEKNMMKAYKGKVKLLLSELKEADAAVLRASALGWEAGKANSFQLLTTANRLPLSSSAGILSTRCL